MAATSAGPRGRDRVDVLHPHLPGGLTATAPAPRRVRLQLVEHPLHERPGDTLSGVLGGFEHVYGDQLGGLMHTHA